MYLYLYTNLPYWMHCRIQVDALAKFAKSELGTVHYWINNAGSVTSKRLLADVPTDEIADAVSGCPSARASGGPRLAGGLRLVDGVSLTCTHTYMPISYTGFQSRGRLLCHVSPCACTQRTFRCLLDAPTSLAKDTYTDTHSYEIRSEPMSWDRSTVHVPPYD